VVPGASDSPGDRFCPTCRYQEDITMDDPTSVRLAELEARVAELEFRMLLLLALSEGPVAPPARQ